MNISLNGLLFMIGYKFIYTLSVKIIMDSKIKNNSILFFTLMFIMEYPDTNKKNKPKMLSDEKFEEAFFCVDFIKSF